DGDHWQSLRVNMPATSVRDVIVHGDDLIAGTHGRGIWILDDITPLRQIGEERSVKASAERSAILFKPQVAYRVRQNTNTDTPIPPDEAAGVNPPDGAIIDYMLPSAASAVTLEILDAAGKSVRRYSSGDPVEHADPATAPVPVYWYRPPQSVATTPGLHRFLFDLHYQPLRIAAGRGGLPIAAVPHDTPAAPTSPWVAPGQYTVKLTVDGASHTQPLTVKMDPRVTTPPLGLSQQFTLSKQLYDGVLAAQKAQQEIGQLRDRSGTALAGHQAFAKKLGDLEGQAGGGFGGGRGAATTGPDTLSNITGTLTQLMNLLQGADVTPTTQLVSAVAERRAALSKLLAQWTALKAEARTQGMTP
ncbi:MAG TPA: hypothetical protein VNG89_10765, partial [Vicinamibacterales bacterium]|nr:hypothetical protein [Vicinamibacterales bacterium]